MGSSCPTISEIRKHAERVYGAELVDVFDVYGADMHDVLEHSSAAGRGLVVYLRSDRRLIVEGRSKAAARRLALETLSALPSKEAP